MAPFFSSSSFSPSSPTCTKHRRVLLDGETPSIRRCIINHTNLYSVRSTHFHRPVFPCSLTQTASTPRHGRKPGSARPQSFDYTFGPTLNEQRRSLCFTLPHQLLAAKLLRLPPLPARAARPLPLLSPQRLKPIPSLPASWLANLQSELCAPKSPTVSDGQCCPCRRRQDRHQTNASSQSASPDCDTCPSRRDKACTEHIRESRHNTKPLSYRLPFKMCCPKTVISHSYGPTCPATCLPRFNNRIRSKMLQLRPACRACEQPHGLVGSPAACSCSYGY